LPIYYPDILHQTLPAHKVSYRERDVMLYALSIGLGIDPLNARELPYVYEADLQVVPAAVTVLGGAGAQAPPAPEVPAGMRLSTFDEVRVLHGEQAVELQRPLPRSGVFTVESRTVAAYDKGPAKGAVIVKESTWVDENGSKVATLTSSVFARGDGGFGGPAISGPRPHAHPDRVADLTVEIPTRPDQALLYRLNGDYNSLHADPVRATRAGFERPILHGLCTYGLTCRAVLQSIADYDADAILSHQARFAAPVFPGETLCVDLWRDGPAVSFEARVKERDVVVIRNGKTVLRSADLGIQPDMNGGSWSRENPA
jgi:acyl dehydratase